MRRAGISATTRQGIKNASSQPQMSEREHDVEAALPAPYVIMKESDIMGVLQETLAKKKAA
jgi:hypothetical protein